jgi:phage virion morphogenesis protein
MGYSGTANMSNELQSLETWANLLLAKLQPAQCRALNQQIAIALRRSQAQRIASQTAPNGQKYVPRKQRPALRSKQRHIRRKKAEMFKKIRLTRHLKTQHDANQISVGFFGRVARIARVHQEGLIDQVSEKSKVKHRYACRALLGFSDEDRTLIREVLLRCLAEY